MRSTRKFRELKPFILLILGCSLVKAEDSNLSLSRNSSIVYEEADKFQKLASIVKPSVVVIESVDRLGREGGRGTGFAVSKDGLIATNFHVIGEHRDFRIRFENGEVHQAKSIAGVDRSRDLALIKIDSDKLKPLRLGNSDNLKAGQTILSIGNPLGYSHSVSRGVIAAIRELEFGDGRPMVQIAIPIEPGSSGSPVLDLQGNVIAMLTIKSGGAMGFGIPVNALKKLLDEKTDPIPMEKWKTIGAIDPLEWSIKMDGNWKQRAGEVRATGTGSGFGGRMLCLREDSFIKAPFEIQVEVKLEDESGAGGLVFCSDQKESHYGFYPTNGSIRLTRFDGPTVYNWKILKTIDSTAYRPNDWNLFHIRIEENSRIIGSVNDQIVVDVIDLEMKEGLVGLCKFREPTARFRNFRFSQRLPKASFSPDSISKARKITKVLLSQEEISESAKNELIDLGKASPQLLNDYAVQLKNKSDKLKSLAKEIRERIVISELVESLTPEDEASIDLLKSALLIARLDNEHFDLNNYLRKADLLAEKIKTKFPDDSGNSQKIKILVYQLFEEMGFHGSTIDFHHRSNSYINEVMDDREGLPITLCILFMELAKRLDLNVTGLGLPGHFLALYKEEPDASHEKSVAQSNKKSREIIIDAYAGKIINRKEASRLTGIEVQALDFTPSPKKDIIRRMLRNLMQVAEKEKDTDSQIRYLDAILAISPEDRYSRAQRAMLFYLLGKKDRALSDINFLLERFPDSPENQPLRIIRNRLMEDNLD